MRPFVKLLWALFNSPNAVTLGGAYDGRRGSLSRSQRIRVTCFVAVGSRLGVAA